jgi:5-methylcytosine-specific restriction endonuclease McrA
MKSFVLVLNANYEPINICDIRRALGLIISDKASLVLNGRGEIRTINAFYPCPSIIRLEKMVTRPRQRVKLTRREVFHRDNYTCQYCGQYLGELTIDHVLPRHLGGKHTWTNVVTACPKCNHRKGGKTNEEVSMHLLCKPTEPEYSPQYLFGRHLADNADWEPYIANW